MLFAHLLEPRDGNPGLFERHEHQRPGLPSRGSSKCEFSEKLFALVKIRVTFYMRYSLVGLNFMVRDIENN